MRRLFSILLLLLSVSLGVGASAPHQQTHVLDATAPHRVRLSYLLFLPAKYASTPDTRWPLILYLHGGSLRGDDVERLRTLGLPHKLESEPDFPFIVVSPQCPAGEIWTDVEGIDAHVQQMHAEHPARGMVKVMTPDRRSRPSAYARSQRWRQIMVAYSPPSGSPRYDRRCGKPTAVRRRASHHRRAPRPADALETKDQATRWADLEGLRGGRTVPANVADAALEGGPTLPDRPDSGGRHRA